MKELPAKRTVRSNHPDIVERAKWPKYEIVYEDDPANPRRNVMNSQNYRFVIDPERWDGFHRLRIGVRDAVKAKIQ